MRRMQVALCTSGDPYHVPSLARVALFPLHLDPPTKQHRELFRLLLGAPDLAAGPSMPSSTASNLASPSSSISTAAKSAAAVAASSSPFPPQSPCVSPGFLSAAAAPSHAKAIQSGVTARGLNMFDCSTEGTMSTSLPPSPVAQTESGGEWQQGIHFASATAPTPSTDTASSSGISSVNDFDPISCGTSSPYWYMEAFATSLREDSQLAPFDYIILIPNTRYPVSLRQSTHLAALAVLAARGLARVHVDFTALEHPDESMPIVYELICRYPNSVLVHWLHDAYEVLNWSHFADFKSTVPMLLLQTQSYPPKALERQRPVGSVSRLTSRQYHSPMGQYMRSPEEADYYRRAQRFMKAASKYRRRNATPMPTATADGVDAERRYESASVVDLESDYFDNVPNVPSPRRKLDEDVPESGTEATSSSLQPEYAKVQARSPLLRGVDTTTRTASTASSSVSISTAGGRATGLKAGLPWRESSSVHGEPGVSYVNCAKGRWWNTPGGRGDDEVEVSRSYWSSTSSSWLGGGTASSAAPPEWMEEEGVTTADHARERHQRRRVRDASTAAAEVHEAGDVFETGDRSGENDQQSQKMDTVVSDDGFALMEDTPADEGVGVGVPRAGSKTNTERRQLSVTKSAADTASTATRAGTAPAVPTSPEGREAADEDTRKRFLTREIEEVRAELKRMLRPASAAAATAVSMITTGGVTTGAAAAAAGGNSPDGVAVAKSSPASGGRVSKTRASITARLAAHCAAGPFGAEDARHEEHYPARRRNRTVRQLIDELYPPRAYASVSAGTSANAASAATEAGVVGATFATDSSHFFSSPHPMLKPRAEPQSCAAAMPSDQHDGSSHSYESGDRNSSSCNAFMDLSAWLDAPMVEVHPITRSTGADVRQALWEQEIHPSFILTDCVQRYVEGHGLYRDPRKATAASLYGSVGVSGDYGNGARSGSGGGGGASGLGGSAGAAGQMGGPDAGFRDSAAAGVCGATSGVGGGMGSSAGGSIGIRRVVAPRDTATLSFPGLIPRLELHYDRNNLLAREQYEKLRIFQCQDGEEPDLIVPIGGDGYMMHCVRKNWRRFIPFYGVNAGHVGYLLNDRSTLEELFSSPLKLHFTTMLYCQAEKEGDTGERMLLSELAFNDAWVERSSGQTALIRILVNGQERIRRLRGDGVLVSTAAGSTAYSQALGASPVPVGAPLIQIVGSNVVSPAQWRPAHLDQEDQVEFEVIDSTKRPCRCYVDSVDAGNVTRLLVRSSRVAGVTLAFSKSCDLQHKLYQMQFPKTL
ncbi:ATP-NAD kinase-like protein [Leishmania major strain Friedlin]|uniref:ATP-NAD kinase-like protein n=1 Tax=Leishmania major TaxID=5664 RepID=Q4QJ32_LEIMA|nr:ATP-NAD kinase-like protein [Leishmania major strain Friedlin]CAG9568841.1 ATP-NAD_kinase-like_protein [Leishmania major strain Friedlin]CAJ02091.1 ATP-NAD kinase-like protein [Leishmania major strain Friedlin]|eukprot:XP_001680816.1 ATP-NAD kinase-like protein [Leishmania major strain Friedlin]